MKTQKEAFQEAAPRGGSMAATGVAERQLGHAPDSSELDLRQRARLLQSKLLGLPLTTNSWPSQAASSPSSSPTPSPRSQSNQEDTRSLSSQCSGASSCSSQAPTPPPRLSSLASRRAETAASQRVAGSASADSTRNSGPPAEASGRGATHESGRLSATPLAQRAQNGCHNYLLKQQQQQAQAVGRPLMQTPSQLASGHQDNRQLVEPPVQFGGAPAPPPELANEPHAISRHQATPPSGTSTAATNYHHLECVRPAPLAANRRQLQQAGGLPARPLTKAIMQQEELKKQQQFVKQHQPTSVIALANLPPAPPTHQNQNQHQRQAQPAAYPGAFAMQPALVQKPMVDRRALRPLPPLPNESKPQPPPPPAVESPQAPPRPPKSRKLGSISSNSTTSLASSYSSGPTRATPVGHQQTLLGPRLERKTSQREEEGEEVISPTSSSQPPVGQTTPQISADSVQLLVQQQLLQQLKAEEAAAAAKKSEEAEAPNVKLEVRRAEEAGALQRPAPKWQPRNDLLMVMQQHRPTQNNDTDSAGAAAESELSSDSFGQSPPRGQWTRSGQAGETAPAPRASSLATISRQEDRAEWQARVEQPAVRQRPLGQVERAISLHMLKQQQRAAASADAAGRLPTLAQLQAQMEAAKAQLRAAQTATQQRADSARADQQRASGHGNASGGDGDSDGAGQSPLATCDSNTTTQHLAPTAARSNFAAANAAVAADSTQTPKTTTTTENSQLEQNSSNRRGSPTATNSSIGPQNGAGELNEVIVLQKVEGRSSSSGSSSGSKFHESEVERRVSEASASTPATCHEGRQMRVGRDFRSESMDSTPAPLPSASPTPQPRLTQNQQQQQLDPIRSELTINVTSPQVAQVPTQPATGRQLEQLEQRLANGGYNCSGQQLPASHRRVRDLAAELSTSCASSCQSTPTNCSSLLSSADSTLTSASSAFIAQLNAANSSELIPRLIERLDRKLVVMKREQLALLREIEANELAGQRLLCAMRKRLTVQEFDKINMQANEIEKVTRLILSLKLRLKRIEAELKEREASTASAASAAAAAAQQRAGSRGELNNTFDHSASSPESCSRLADESDRRQQSAIESESDEEVQLRIAQTSQHLLNALQQQQQQSRGSNLGASSAGHTTGGSRGLSDPTSTSGLPKRNHQHHASLQSAASIKAAGCKTGGSADGEARQKHEHAASSGSSDSIFNSADSAIGGSCTLASDSSSSAHGGSSNNLNHQRPASHSQAGSAAGSSPSRHSHLSSSISVSSHSSMASSVPSSPSLMSPTSSNTQGAANSHQEQPALKSRRDSNNNNNSNSSANSTSLLPTSGAHKPTGELLDGASLMALNLVSELEILQAKRNKLLSQLEEAHQLEECIVKRNSNIVDRILSKYQPSSTDSQSEESNELLEFKQFTKLKSLLLKDSHDIADRIDSAELQLSELRHSAGEPI